MNRKIQKNQKSALLLIGTVLYIALAAIVIAQLINVSPVQEELTFEKLSDETKKGIEAEAQRSVLSVDEFVDKYVVSTTGIEVQINKTIFLVLCALVGLPLYYFLSSMIIQRINNNVLSGEQDYDQTRINHLQVIKKELDTFFRHKQRYPSDDEYIDLLNSIEVNLVDPKNGKQLHDSQKDRFGYYYDQYNPETQRNEQTYYHLWCFLENGTRYELTSQQL